MFQSRQTNVAMLSFFSRLTVDFCTKFGLYPLQTWNSAIYRIESLTKSRHLVLADIRVVLSSILFRHVPSTELDYILLFYEIENFKSDCSLKSHVGHISLVSCMYIFCLNTSWFTLFLCACTSPWLSKSCWTFFSFK